ncbi:ABC transporter ATP-binding protein [Bacillus sp. CMF21]|uniref:ABC transporter ATP-binding protein n=1 Tax=Metabacillus dongyingensis TaxID=2874282 RepID=UPI001CC0DD72|nr:ABC transporter ATP-binding protein [Metabacillus dongyingensis]UAL53698.1 ABC transporter ATP-binding protein [Metabacillus dongyingensis]UOK59132.1 ABC transporter ATP-binding protein [Bacillus sp. OVS6]USK30009.1 ABC transporter ATP-binding protein [Bacillus sp. CMF21]
MTQYALEVQSLTKKIGKKTIVDDVSFQVEKGEIFGLLGPNGAGKTTIIRMIVSLINRTGGNVIINGHNLDDSFKEAMSEIGAIVENPEFYKYMSGLKNIRHYERMAVKDISEKRRNEVIELVGLQHAMHQKVKTYSLGMRQRLGVAQSLLHNPSVLIFDEPTNGLDPQGIREFRDYLRKLADDGISVLVSSHLLSEMQLMCDRFAIIEKGKLIHISSMHDSMEESKEMTREVIFEVSDSSEAAILIKEKGLYEGVIEANGEQLKLHLDKEKTMVINQLLVQNGVGVYGIVSHKATLEDRFLELTNKEKKEQMQ